MCCMGHRSSRFQQVRDIHHLLGQCPAVPNIFQHMRCAGSTPSSTRHFPAYAVCWVNAQQYPTFSSICNVPAVPDIGIWAGFGLIPTFLGQCPAVSDIFQQVPDIHHLLGKRPAVASSTRHRDFGGIWLNPDIFQHMQCAGSQVQQIPASTRHTPFAGSMPSSTQHFPASTRHTPTAGYTPSSCQQLPAVPDIGIWLNPDIFQHAMCWVTGPADSSKYPTYNICWVKAQQYPTFSSKYQTYTICWVNAQQLPAVPNIGIWAGFGLIPTFSSICNVLGHRFQQVPNIHHLLGQRPAVPDNFQHIQYAGSKVQQIPAST